MCSSPSRVMSLRSNGLPSTNCNIGIQISSFRQYVPGTDLNQPPTRRRLLVRAGDVGQHFSGELWVQPKF
jgi:hypothetical protein